jgi:ribosomal protein L44E
MSLTKVHHIEVNNKQLKEQLEELHGEMDGLESHHRQQMMEAVENLQAVQEAHKKDMQQLQMSTNYQMKREAESIQRALQEKVNEIETLQKQLSDSEREKHTEIVKLRLEVSKCRLKHDNINHNSCKYI